MGNVSVPASSTTAHQDAIDALAAQRTFSGGSFFSTFIGPDPLGAASMFDGDSGSGNCTYIGDTDGKPAISLSTGATASSTSRVYAVSLGGTLPKLAVASASKYELSFDMRMASAIDNVTIAGWCDYPNINVAIGIVGSQSTTKFVAYFAGLVMVSTVNIDTGWHRISLRRNGTDTYFAVDGETPIVNASGVYATAMSPMLAALNGATAADRTALLRNIYMAL